MPLLRIARLAAIGVLLGAVSRPIFAAGEARIAGSIDGRETSVLTGGVSPRVAVSVDLGEAPAERKLGAVTLHFSRTPAQETALEELLVEQQTPGSAQYHRWLTPEAFQAQFGLAASDVAKVTTWLSGQGLTVTEVARGGEFVRFTGSVAQVEAAFKTSIHNVSLNGETHVANVTSLTLPTAVALVTAGVSGLDDFKPAARTTLRGAVSGKASATETTAGGVLPQYSSGGTNYLAPGDFYTIYDETSLLSSVTGKGVAIAVMGQSDIKAFDILSFETAAGLASNAVTTQLYGADPGFPSPGDLQVAEQGLEWADAAAPGASLIYVNSFNVLDGSLTEAIDNDVAPVLVMSYAECEADLGTSALAFYGELLEQGSAEGITLSAASGDTGATGCDAGSASAVNGLAVNFPASSPFATGVGGTQFNEGSGTYWSGTNGAHGGSALSYIPEVVWNNDGSTGISASGGGASLFYPKPSWQTGTGVPSDYSRDVPDVAMSGSSTHDAYLVCVSFNTDECVNGFMDATGNLQAGGGTSLAASTVAGFLALVEQKTGGTPLGNVNPTIYALASSGYSGSVFNDITSGTNASPCTKGSVNCANGGSIGYTANHGFDLTTGWGSLNAYTLVNDWSLVTALPTTPAGVTPTVTYVAGAASSVTVGSSVAFTISVAPASSSVTGTPTGSVEISLDGVGTTSVTLASGAGTYTLPTASLAVGSHTVTATYLGDGTFSGSKGAFALTVVAGGAPSFALSPSTASVTVAAGSIAQAIVFTVSPLNGFAGTVQLTAGLPSSLGAQASFTVDPVTVTATSGASTALNLFAYTGASHETPVKADFIAWTWKRGAAGVALSGLLLILLPRRRRMTSLLLLLLVAGASGMVGCTNPPYTPQSSASNLVPTPAGTYTVTVSATGTSSGTTVTQYATVTFIVQ